MFLRNLSRVAAVGIGGAGFAGGMFVEKYRNYAQVNAAGSFSGYDAGGGAVIPMDQEPHVPKVKPTRASQIMKFGFPGMDNIRSYNDFVLSYDQRNRVPHWVFEHLTRNHIKHNPEVDRSKCDFYEDSSIHPFFRAHNSDYKGSGYDRGHLAAAGNHRLSQTHVGETFVLSNIAPQVGKGFNRDAWNTLEKYVRGLTRRYENVYVCSGPLYLPRREADGKYYVRALSNRPE
ncbi:Endonuclease G, mitochondrial [Orchesella cincta]|uniref:Endonuclease n=1 Tax=Orchesella cincta TaxID=48709 RepID=A0A1D2MN42_ORCCI|nr:Endonuclease G, mitochondrial [Orchesella cincta]